GGLIALGVDTAVPEYGAIQAGTAAATTLPARAPALVLWGFAFGLRAGDAMALRLDGPGGPVVDETVALDRTQARAFRAVGRKARGPWPEGTYRGSVTLIRDGEALDSREVEVTVR